MSADNGDEVRAVAVNDGSYTWTQEGVYGHAEGRWLTDEMIQRAIPKWWQLRRRWQARQFAKRVEFFRNLDG